MTTLIKETVSVSETSAYLHYLTRLSARDNYIERSDMIGKESTCQVQTNLSLMCPVFFPVPFSSAILMLLCLF